MIPRYPHSTYSDLFTKYFLYVRPFYTLLALYLKGQEAFHVSKYALWVKECKQITSEQIGGMIEKETRTYWGSGFSLRTIRQAQAAMSNRLGIKRLQDACDDITKTHHRSMGHSEQTGRIEYDREAQVTPCQDDKMERHKILCDYVHIHQWGLDGRSTHRPVGIQEEISSAPMMTRIEDRLKRIEGTLETFSKTMEALSRLVKNQQTPPGSGLPRDLRRHEEMQDEDEDMYRDGADLGVLGGADWLGADQDSANDVEGLDASLDCGDQGEHGFPHSKSLF